MHLRIAHTTRYRYDAPVDYGLQRLRLTPRDGRSQKIASWNVSTTGASVEARYDDHFGNRVMLLNIEPGAEKLEIDVEGIVETLDTNGIVGPHPNTLPLWLFQRQTDLTLPGSGVCGLAEDLRAQDRDALGRLHALSARIMETVAYRTGTSDAKTTAEEALSNGSGVCQDQTHVFLSAARRLGYPARYVSGYLMMNDRIDQEAGHAWAEAHVDGLGWVGFDVSNGISPDDRYLRVATGLDYREAAPVSGLRFGTAGESLDVAIQVQQ